MLLCRSVDGRCGLDGKVKGGTRKKLNEGWHKEEAKVEEQRES